jgi:hypothetical protein
MKIFSTQALTAHCRDTFVDIRVEEGTTLSKAVFSELWEVLHMCSTRKGRPIRSLIVMPERFDYPMSLLVTSEVNPLASCVEAQAVVVPSAHHRALAYSQEAAFPRSFAYRVFADEQEASAWLNTLDGTVVG